MRALTRLAVRAALCVPLALAALLGAASGARAAVPTAWDTLSRDIAAAWPSQQTAAGRFRDYTDQFYTPGFAFSRYGDSLLGYGLMQTGVRDGRPDLIRSGLDGIRSVLERPKKFYKRGSVFEYMGMASAYNLARSKLAGDPAFQRIRPAWEQWLRSLRPISTIYRRPQTSRYSNHYLIEAIAVLELERSGLRSNRPGSILGGKRALTRRLTARLLNSDVPRMAARSSVVDRGRRTFVFSDPPDQPLAYHGFSAGFYARGLQLLGGAATRRARDTLREVANASVALTAPDGDLAYFGRGQEDVWALTATALGTESAARLPGTRAGAAASYRAVTERALARARDDYGNGPQGLWVTPALRKDLRGGVRGTDASTGAPSFAGVALVSLNWALDEMVDARRPIGSIGADRSSAVQLSSGVSRFAAVRRGDLWYAVRRSGSTRAPRDLRNDFGLVALKVAARGRLARRAADPAAHLAPPRQRGAAAAQGGPHAVPAGQEPARHRSRQGRDRRRLPDLERQRAAARRALRVRSDTLRSPDHLVDAARRPLRALVLLHRAAGAPGPDADRRRPARDRRLGLQPDRRPRLQLGHRAAAVPRAPELPRRQRPAAQRHRLPRLARRPTAQPAVGRTLRFSGVCAGAFAPPAWLHCARELTQPNPCALRGAGSGGPKQYGASRRESAT